MEIKIGKKNQQLKFGLKFVRELDKVFKVDTQGLQFGMGINLAFIQLTTKNPTTLAEVIKAATAHNDNAPTLNQVDEAIEDYADEHGDLGILFDQIIEEMGKSKVIKHTIKDVQEKARTTESNEAQ